MTIIRVRSTFHRLVDDLTKVATESRADMVHVVRRNADAGNRLAKSFAKDSAGAHGKHYHRAFGVEQRGPLAWEYGPDSAMPQGDMAFESGSRNQPPHNDLAKSQDIQGPLFHADVDDMVDDWFW